MKPARRRLLTFDFATPRVAVPRWLRVQRTAMACRFEVTLDEDRVEHLDAVREALDEADRIEALLTVFSPASELSRINREAHGATCVADQEVAGLLRRCQRLAEDTEGAFDITSTPLSRCWGFLRREARIPDQPFIDSALAVVGVHRLRVDDDGRVRFEREGMELNLGAIGKGYAIDRMGEMLRHRGVVRALLSAGSSSVLAIGGRGRGWPIDITSPQRPGSRIARLHVRDGALGTSGAGVQFTMNDGRRYGHVVDPRTGWPARGLVSISVVTSSAADADALSTAFLVGGPELAVRYCETHPSTLALLTLDDPGRPTLVCGSYDGADLED